MQQRNLLTGGLSLALRNWPAFVWTYVFNLGLAALFTLPLHLQMSAITAQTLVSQRMVNGFDLGVMRETLHKLGEGPGSAVVASYFSTPLYLVLFFLLVPGTLFCYQTEAPARLSTLFQSGILHFWRFIRITLISFLIFGVILGGLIALQKQWAAHVDAHTVGRASVLHELAGVVIIGLVAAALRVYFDLVEVYTVQLGLQTFPVGLKKKSRPNRKVRRAFKPAWRALRHNFLRAYLTFVFLALLGLSAVVLTAHAAMRSLAQPHIWLMFVLAQTGLLVMLFTRFWQRGAETILALDNPLPTPVIIVIDPVLPVPVVAEPVVAEPVIAEPDALPLEPEE